MTDENSFEEISPDLISNNPLQFQDKLPYVQRLQSAIKTTGIKDTTVCGTATIDGKPVALAVMDFRFLGGSMGVVPGEKVALAMDIGFEKKIPVIVVSCSGGARMQEATYSLMQLAKVQSKLAQLSEAGLLYIAYLCDPTFGGITASFAMTADIIMAEPKALIGFAGPRVIEQTVREKLPDGFQRSEFLMQKGGIDMIVDRRQMRNEIARLLALLQQLPEPAIAGSAAV
jgi:acetyl-CoA carboxylase carboxyl transferase subunit beta